jgi:hypothetical protein
MNPGHNCLGMFPGGYCLGKRPCPCPINPNPIYGGCTTCVTYSSIPTECPCPGNPGCYKYPSCPLPGNNGNRGIGCNCAPKLGGLLPCKYPPAKVHYLQTYAGLPPPSHLVPGYLNQGTDGNFKTRWLPVTWGDLLGCANKFHMKGLKLKEDLLIHKPCVDVCDCCCNNLNRGERLRIISHGKRVYGAGDEVLRCQAMRNRGNNNCSICHCPVS